MTQPEPSDLDALIADFILALERGLAPDPADWLARHPTHAAELARFLRDLGQFGPFLGLPVRFRDVTTCNLTTEEFHQPGGSLLAFPSGFHGKRFGEYELLEVIGEGGMGTVYRARLTGTNLVVALKQVRAGGLSGAEAARRLREEVENAAGLRHPNIVPIYYVGEHAGEPFYTMALIEGGSLAGCLDRFQGNFSATAELLVKTARAVHHAHMRRVLHRDLKPANILIDTEGEPHVADFGLATRLDETGSASGAGPLAGSLPWMAPETVRPDPALSAAVDVWALGVILYELLTGERPFRADDRGRMRQAILEQDPPQPRQLNRRVPRDLEAICRRCLNRDPNRRYESASAVALDLERWLHDEPVRARQPGRGERFARWCRRNTGLAVATAVLIAFLFAGTAAALSFTRDQDARLRAAVCKSNEYAAGHVASTVHRRLDQLSEPVIKAANSSALRLACQGQDTDRLHAVLKSLFDVPRQGQSPFASVYLLNPSGKIVALVDLGRNQPGDKFADLKPYPYRDYFLGAMEHKGEPEPKDRVHLSRIFRSENDDLDKLAISTVVWLPGPPAPPWILAATITTDASLGLDNLHDESHTVVLLAPRDSKPPREGAESLPPGYVILVHPAFNSGERTVPFPLDQPGAELPRNGKPELQSGTSLGAFPTNDHYTDPTASNGYPAYEGRWLTGSARIANTELVILVQQRYADAIAPHQGFFLQFYAWVGGAVVVGVVLFLGLRRVGSRRAR